MYIHTEVIHHQPFHTMYFSSSQSQAWEHQYQQNGVYATELLKHIRSDRRIEHILMDVNEGILFVRLTMIDLWYPWFIEKILPFIGLWRGQTDDDFVILS